MRKFIREDVDRKRGQHAGLLLHRYLRENATSKEGNPQEKRDVLLSAIQAIKDEQVKTLYSAAFARWKQSLPTPKREIMLKAVGRLIVGLGTESVLETGIRLHHNYGFPILPGSALKGLASHYCSKIWGEANDQFKITRPFHEFLFGTTDESGCVIFHDAWFVPDSEEEPLKMDVMTPHHPQWLDGTVPPTDFDSPNPVPFLSVAGKFHLAVTWFGPACKDSEIWLKNAFELLCDALAYWGIGGKTSSGYGRFEEVDWVKEEEEEVKRKAEEEKKQKLAQMTPFQRDVEEFLLKHPNKAAPNFMNLYEELIKPNSRWTDFYERREIAERIKREMIEAKKWTDKDKDGKRKQRIEEILSRPDPDTNR